MIVRRVPSPDPKRKPSRMAEMGGTLAARRAGENEARSVTTRPTTRATMMVRADVAESTHGFDESFHMFCEEIDWSWRVREAGWDIYAVPSAEVIHYGGESTSQVPADPALTGLAVLILWV